jgi:hypothetical protein
MGHYLDLFDRLGNFDGAGEGVTTKTTETTKANVKANSLPECTTHDYLWSFMSYDRTRSGVSEALAAAEALEGASVPPPSGVTEATKRGYPSGTEASTDGFGLALSSWDDAEQERDPIVKFEGIIPRAWAEGFGRLHPDRPPGDVPARRWLRFIDDVGLFLDSPFCATAVALGWGPYDLFGCDRTRPFARIDHLGLVWFLDGGRLLALTADTATIKKSNGSILTYRRRAGNERGRVLAWELQ